MFSGEILMAQDVGHFLDELPIWKLKTVAAEFRIDVSACRYKRDFVEKIRAKKLTEQQVRNALAKAKNEPTQTAEEAEVREIGKEIEGIAQRPVEPAELPKDEEKKVERHIDEALTMKPSFFEVDSMTEGALNKMIVGDFNDAIRQSREARMKCLESFSTFQVYSAAASIRAADELLAKIPDDKGRLDQSLRTALAAAKRAFIGGSPRQREEALENLEELAAKTYSAFLAGTERDESELKDLLADYESFGTRTEEPRKYLEIAASAKQAFDFAQYERFMQDARERAETARDVRKNEIENSFHLVRASAAEAKDIGADTTSAEADFAKARKAFDDGAFKRAVDLLASVERATDGAHLRRIRAQKELESRQMERISSTLLEYGPILREASGYGMNVQESLSYIDSVRSALSRDDVVTAAKYARRVREKTDAMEKELDQKRLELGVIRHIDGARCGKCGQESLYSYPNATQKCIECGHAFQASLPVAVGKRVEAPKKAVEESATGGTVEKDQPRKKVASKESPEEKPDKKKKGFFKW